MKYIKYIKHFLTITKHKWYVMIECFKVGLIWQGITHDLSKYSLVEFGSSAKYFQGDKTPIGIEKAEPGYSYAWLNHKAKNKHHWEYWIDFKKGKLLKCPIPDKYILEMACDIKGASKSYGTNNPYEHFKKNQKYMLMEKDSKKKLEKLLAI